ncbi:MAG: peptidoglycan DD-metalloendopeptidase family protein [Bacteroidales bacterium]|nr:peptidoglycan DD-metalloendopeptidase family protein [Bacteroidales bacterium]
MRNTLSRIVLLLSLLLSAAMSGTAQDIKEHESRKAQLEKEIAILDRQISANASKSRDALSQLTLIRKRIANRKELVAESDRQIKVFSDRIYLTQKQINRLQERVDTLSDYYARLVKSAYRNRDAKIWYMYIIASEDLGQAFRRYSYFRNLSDQMKDQAEKIRLAKAELEVEKEGLRKLKDDAEKLREQRRRELASLQKEEQQQASVVSSLKRNRTRYENELAAKKKQVTALNREIERLVAAAIKASQKSDTKKKEIDYRLAEEFAGNKGKLPWPVDGVVVDRFGQHYHPVFTKVKLPFNNGITIAVNAGSAVNAVFDGAVKQIVVMPGYNQCVLVQHGNYFSFYCKLKTTSVKAGDKVKTGQKIGVVDTINGDTQLHFQVWKGQSPQNPEIWLRAK